MQNVYNAINHLFDKNTLEILPNDNNESFHKNDIHFHSEKVVVKQSNLIFLFSFLFYFFYFLNTKQSHFIVR